MRKSIAILISVFALILSGTVTVVQSVSSASTSSGIKFTTKTPSPKGNLNSVTWNLPTGEPASLDWIYTWDTGAGNTVLSNLCEGLMREQPDGKIVPALATSVSTPNASTYIYTIRRGVKFSNGDPMTVADVVYSLNRNVVAADASYWGGFFTGVSSIKQSGPWQVTVKFTKPNALFGEAMALPASDIGQESYIKAEGTKYGTPAGGVMCTGPYSLKKWISGTSITLQSNPHYWDAALKPKVKTFEFTFITDASTITEGLITGSIEGTWEAPISGFSQLKASSSGKLYANKSAFFTGMEMASFQGSLKNVKIREALQALIDYKGIVNSIYMGAATPLASPATPPSWGSFKNLYSKAYDSLPPAKQNLSKARKLIQEAGGAPKAPIVIAVNASNQTQEEIGASIESSASQVGLKVKIDSVPTANYNDMFFEASARKGKDALMVTTTGGDIPDPLELYQQVLPGSTYNYTGYDNPGFALPIEKALVTSNPTKRAELVIQGQASYVKEVQMLPVIEPDELLYLNNKITGPAVSTLGYLYYPWAATIGRS
jgi:peptide/nickel transport system substrate-binding protein